VTKLLRLSSFLDRPMLLLERSWMRFRRGQMRRRLQRERRREEILLLQVERQHQRSLRTLQRAEQWLNLQVEETLPEPPPQVTFSPEAELFQEQPMVLTPGTPLDPEPLLMEETPEPAVDQISRILASKASPDSTSQS